MCTRRKRTIIRQNERGADEMYAVYRANRLVVMVRVVGSSVTILDVGPKGYVTVRKRRVDWNGYPGHTRMKRMTGVDGWIERV